MVGGHVVGSPHDPAADGHVPVESFTEGKGGFRVDRFTIKVPWLARRLSGNPQERSDGGYDSVIVVSDHSGRMLARMSHWDGDVKLVVGPDGVRGPDGFEWLAVAGSRTEAGD